MRVHRAVAHAGLASRRAAERLVAEGRVTVNGRPATLGQVVAPDDQVVVDGRRADPETRRVYLLNKAAGTVSTVDDPQGRPTVLDALPDTLRLYPVGRLDLDTTGALVITNDGDLANRLMHPRSKVPKTYEVLVDGRVSAATLRQLRSGVELEDGWTQPAKVTAMRRLQPGGTWLLVELTEGRNRQIKRMMEAVGHRVRRLHRSRYGGIGLRGLRTGEWRPLSREEVARLEGPAGRGGRR